MSELGNLAFSRVMREQLHDPEVIDLAHSLHVRLPKGEELNNVVIVKEHGEDQAESMLGMAILTPGQPSKPGTLISQGEAIVQTSESLNGNTEVVQRGLTNYIGRIARQRGFSSLRISEVTRERVDMRDKRGRKTGQQMTVYYPIATSTIRL